MNGFFLSDIILLFLEALTVGSQLGVFRWMERGGGGAWWLMRATKDKIFGICFAVLDYVDEGPMTASEQRSFYSFC